MLNEHACIIQYVHFCPQFFQGITIVMNTANLRGGGGGGGVSRAVARGGSGQGVQVTPTGTG